MASTPKHKMGTLQLTLITVVNMMGSGIILLPAQLADVGNITIFSWLLTALGAMALAYGFAKCGRYSKNMGGMGGYAQYSFGKSGNMLANYTYAIAILIANVAVAITAVGYFCEVFNIKINTSFTAVLSMLFLWAATLPNFWSSKITGIIGSITVWGVILPVIGVILIGWHWFQSDTYIAGWNPHNLKFFEALPQALALTMWAFLGLESASANSDAVENPEKAVPIAVLAGTLFTATIYILSSAIIGGMLPYELLASSSAPFGLVYSHMFGGSTGKLVEILMLIACLGSLLTWQFTIGQVFKSCADIGYFFRIFAKITKKGSPIAGLIIICSIQCLLLIMSSSSSFSQEFNIIVNLSVVIDLIPYILCMSACTTILKSSEDYKNGQISKHSTAFVGIICLFANIYTFYAIYSAGSQAIIYGSLMTFAGWVIYGSYTSSLLNKKIPINDQQTKQ